MKNKIKVSDYIVDFLVKHEIKNVFGVTGGVIIHLFNSIGKRKDINYICNQHEQASAMACDGYSRITKNFGVAISTSGAGATNLITGICCAYYDSIPTLFITGQVSTSRLRKNKKVRQLGFQETPIVDICKPITKYSSIIKNPNKIRYELEKAIYIAKSGRGGAVLLDIPDDIQRSYVNENNLKGYSPKEESINSNLKNQIKRFYSLIEKSKRPIIVLGAGIKLGKCEKEAITFIRKLGFPVLLTWGVKDILLENDKLNAGVFGVASKRYGNFTIQNSDLIIAIGTRMNQHHTGNLNTFAREAKKILIDVDKYELNKFSELGMKWDLLINLDAKDFLKNIKEVKTQNISDWKKRIRNWKKHYSICENIIQKDYVNINNFIDELSNQTKINEIIVVDTGSNLVEIMSKYKVNKKQTIFSDLNNTSMGYSLPASIGACFANNKKQVICITGDGGIQMNIQELATIKYHNLPIKIFVFNNSGYGMIKKTQDDWIDSNYDASDIKKGIAIPNFVKIGKAYGLRSEEIKNDNDLGKIKEILEYNKPILCNINISPDERVSPMLKAGRPIEDQEPLLSRNELIKQMIIKPLK